MDDRLDDASDRLLLQTSLILGVSLLFPFYCFVTAVEYFASHFGENFEFEVGVCHNVPNFCLLLLQICYLRQVLQCDIRIKTAFIVYIFGLIFMPICLVAQVETSVFRASSLVVVCFIGAAASLLQGTLFSVVAQLGPRYMRMLFVGNAGAGLVTGVLRVVTILFLNPQSQTLVFFIVATFVTACCFAQYMFASRRIPRMYDIVKRNPRESLRERAELLNAQEYTTVSVYATLKSIIPDIWMAIAGVFLSFALTLNLFPGVIVTLPMRSSVIEEASFRLFLIMNYLFGDFLGRMLNSADIGSKTPQQAARDTLLMSLARIALFITTFYFLRHGTFIQNGYIMDGICAIAVLTMAVSNGLLASKCMVISPMLVRERGNIGKEYAGLLMTGGLTAGIMTGSVTGLLWM